ncbi:MAG: LysR family transcriptional regulator, partial [Lactobacillus sp.]|nr:LysR family transcriptional regulator [Lactobacillus sp.]
MNLDHLEIFIDLAETLNFRKTAYRKNISQPAVSQAISSIENEIGVHLFKRSRSGVELLAKGKILYENIKPLINTYYKSIQEVRQSNGEDTLITIGLTNSPYEQNFLPELLPKFQSAHPQTKIFLQNYDHLQLK